MTATQHTLNYNNNNHIYYILQYISVVTLITVKHLSVQMLERSPRTLPRTAVRLGVITVVMGTSLHLAADSVTRRLMLIGYQLHLSVRENPVLKNLNPSSLVGAASQKPQKYICDSLRSFLLH